MQAQARADEEILDILYSAADGDTVDVAEWPRCLEALLQRLHDIVYSQFPLPHAPLSPPRSIKNGQARRSPGQDSRVPESSLPEITPTQQSEALTEPAETYSEQSPGGNKENAAPEANIRPHAQQDRQSAPSQGNDDRLAAFPDLLDSYNATVGALKTTFSAAPPYTIQRLSELVLRPKKHYRYLPPYLAALERVTSVSSPTTSFPLAQPRAAPNGIVQLNGGAEDPSSANVSGDEGLGGALLTPIPWLRRVSSPEDSRNQDDSMLSNGTTTSEEMDGMGSIETRLVEGEEDGTKATTHVSNPLSHGPIHEAVESEMRELGGVTQGELLRQEQEAGVVPVAQSSRRTTTVATGEAGEVSLGTDSGVKGEDDGEKPHARGPDEIGMEDLGPQSRAIGADRPLDLNAALGKKPAEEGEAAAAQGEAKAEEASVKGEEDERKLVKDEDGDYVLVDAASEE